MNRNTRTLIVLAAAILVASVASYAVYLAVKSIPVREVEVAHTFVVAANKPLAAGARITPEDLKMVPWPASSRMPGSFEKVEQVVNRGVIYDLLENEPVTESKLAPVEAGAGLTPTIKPGMRAISVRVNEVVGVAGFVTPGTKVDVYVTLKDQAQTLTRVVVSNVTVLTAGTRYDQNAQSPQAIPTSVVTLLLTPEDAERVVLASNDGQIMLALRNPLDVEPTLSPGIRSTNLFGGAAAPAKPAAPSATPARKPAAAPVVAAPPPPPQRYSVEAIRGAKRTEETVQ